MSPPSRAGGCGSAFYAPCRPYVCASLPRCRNLSRLDPRRLCREGTNLGQGPGWLVIFWLNECLALSCECHCWYVAVPVRQSCHPGVPARGINRIPRYVFRSLRIPASWPWAPTGGALAGPPPGRRQPTGAVAVPRETEAVKMNIGHVCDGISVTGPWRQKANRAAPERWTQPAGAAGRQEWPAMLSGAGVTGRSGWSAS